MDSTAAKVQQTLEIAQKACPGERIDGLFILDRNPPGNELEIPWRSRPWVLNEPGVKRAPIRKFFSILWRVITLDLPSSHSDLPFNSSPEMRARLRRASTEKSSLDAASSVFFGPEQSRAGQLLLAHPRSKANLQHLICFTEHEIKQLHIPLARRLKHYANAVAVTARVPRKELEWIRVSPRWGQQYGFTDGSWITLRTFELVGHGDPAGIFANPILPTEPIPASPRYPEPEGAPKR